MLTDDKMLFKNGICNIIDMKSVNNVILIALNLYFYFSLSIIVI